MHMCILWYDNYNAVSRVREPHNDVIHEKVATWLILWYNRYKFE